MRINKVVAAVIGVVVLLALCAGTSLLVVNNTTNHNLAVQRAAATASHKRAVASARAQARTDALNKAIAVANRKAEKAARDARRAKRAARQAANKPAPAPVAAAPAQAAPAQQPGQDGYVPSTSNLSVVEIYLSDISSGDFADAWALGGGNIAGTDYSSWVAGYATTTSVILDSDTDLGGGAVQVSFTALQSDGGSTSYAGTYYVSGGVITSASITQTG